MNSFFCLSVVGAPFAVLFYTEFLINSAKLMKQLDTKKLTLAFDDVETGLLVPEMTGILQTEFRDCYLGPGVSGVMFTATIETAQEGKDQPGITKISFLVAHEHLNNKVATKSKTNH